MDAVLRPYINIDAVLRPYDLVRMYFYDLDCLIGTLFSGLYWI